MAARVRTDSFAGFAALWCIGGLRRWRRKLLRHRIEAEHLERWYKLALGHVTADYALAVEILNCRRLIKGYSDTHVRAQSKFDRVLSGLPLLEGRADAAEWLRRLREAALKDEDGTMLRRRAEDGRDAVGRRCCGRYLCCCRKKAETNTSSQPMISSVPPIGAA